MLSSYWFLFLDVTILSNAYHYDCNLIFTGWNHGVKHFSFTQNTAQLTIFKFKLNLHLKQNQNILWLKHPGLLPVVNHPALSNHILSQKQQQQKCWFEKSPFGLQIESVLYPVTICPAWSALTNKKWWLMNAQRAWHVLTKHPLTTSRLNKQSDCQIQYEMLNGIQLFTLASFTVSHIFPAHWTEKKNC